jgi:hypothetical protein
VDKGKSTASGDDGVTYARRLSIGKKQRRTQTSLLGSWRRAAVEEALSTQAKRKLLLGQLKEQMRVKPASAVTTAAPQTA